MFTLPEHVFKRGNDKPEAMTKRYMPRTFDELLGQPLVVRRLKRYVARPYSCAMLFHSPGTGVGKSSCALILAKELLGDSVDDGEFGGLIEMGADRTPGDIRDLSRQLHLRPLGSHSGWQFVICNECDRMLASRPNETVWLNVLESLPPRVCIIFTSNEVSRLSQRFRDRCEEYAFESGEKLRPQALALARRIWQNEIGSGEPPAVSFRGVGEDGGISFRLMVQQLSAAIALTAR